MRRLIASRPVRLAFAAALTLGIVAGVVVVARRRRSAAWPGRPRSGLPTPLGQEPAARRAPEPVLGWPTAEDLKRFDRPEGGALIARLVAKGSPTPRFADLDGPIRSRTARWAAVAAGLLVLFLASQALDAAVFGDGDPGTSFYGMMEGVKPGPGCQEEEDGSCEVFGTDTGPLDEARPPEPAVPAEPPSPDPQPSPADPGCEPAGTVGKAVGKAVKAPVVRPVGRRVTAAVNRQWRRIEKWLKAHAPATFKHLNQPASARVVAKAEAALGLRFPDSLRASLLRHDGASGGLGFQFPPFYGMATVKDMVAYWNDTCEVGGRWVPFAVASDGGEYLLADSRSGEIGQWSIEGALFTATRSSYYSLLKATADSLVTGAPIDGFVPTVTGGELDWEVQ